MDQREIRHQWWERFDEAHMRLVVLDADDIERELPATYAVCAVCSGTGTHVNPSIDSQGLSAEDFAEDPDFAEEYTGGRYDVPCAACAGMRVRPIVSETASQDERDLAAAIERGYYDEQAEAWQARELGY